MKSNVNNLQKEIGLLANNPVFLAQFLDEPIFDIPAQSKGEPLVSMEQSAEEYKEINSPMVENQLLKIEEVPTESIETKQAIEETSTPKDSKDTEPTTLPVDWEGKVLVLTPKIPSASEIILLQKVLSAVSLSANDFVHLQRSLHAKELIEFESAKIILSFGAVRDFAADHQVRSKRITVIISSPLHALEQDVEAKKKLWLSLKEFFA
jgi:hypothetical protein